MARLVRAELFDPEQPEQGTAKVSGTFLVIARDKVPDTLAHLVFHRCVS